MGVFDQSKRKGLGGKGEEHHLTNEVYILMRDVGVNLPKCPRLFSSVTNRESVLFGSPLNY